MKRNKILSAVLVIFMLFSILTASTIFGSSDVVHPGDVNRDGEVCVKDIFDLQRYLAGDEGAIVVPTTTTTPPAMPQVFSPIRGHNALEGESIPFKVAFSQSGGFGSTNERVFIINSITALETAKEMAFTSAEDYTDIDRYDDEFFAQNTLILLLVNVPTPAYGIEVSDVVRNNDELGFKITRGELIFPGPPPPIGAWWQYYIEVERDYISDINRVRFFMPNLFS